jgi:hypothetical protein
MEPVPEQGVIPCCKGDPLYCFQKEQTMQDDMAARTGKILDRYQVNQNEVSFSGQAVIV